MEIVIAAVVVALGLAAGLVWRRVAARPPGTRAGRSAPRRHRAVRRGRADRRRQRRGGSQGAPGGDGAPRGAPARQGGGARRAAHDARPPRGGVRGPAGRDRVGARAPRARARAGLGPERLAGQADPAARARGRRRATTARAACAQIEEETKRDAERRVRNILSVVMQRMAAGHAAETTVSVVQLSADDMKGRIIGREGRNIRALEHLTGVDFIIDDTPNAVILSGFDGVRREIARMTLEKLLLGRPHPPGPHRGDLLPGQVGAREPHAGGGRAGVLRRQRRRPRPRDGAAARPPEVPHQLRPERARPLGRVRPPRRR